MSYNALLKLDIVTDVATEPVTLEEVKRHLNMQFETTEGYEFTDDDQYITDLIPQAREAIERVTGYSMAPKTLRATVRNGCGGYELPYGPVTNVISIIDDEDEVIEATIRNGVIVTEGDYQVIEYETGYTVIPPSMKRALLEEIAWMYNHRGEENDVKDQNRRLAKLNKKRTWLL